MKRLTRDTKPTGTEEEALVEVEEAEASMEAEALVEDHLVNNTISRIIPTNPIQMDHLQQSTLISRAMLHTVTTVHHLPEEIGMEIITEMRQSIVLQQLMHSYKIPWKAWRQW